jgi:hypothetical protein
VTVHKRELEERVVVVLRWMAMAMVRWWVCVRRWVCVTCRHKRGHFVEQRLVRVLGANHFHQLHDLDGVEVVEPTYLPAEPAPNDSGRAKTPWIGQEWRIVQSISVCKGFALTTTEHADKAREVLTRWHRAGNDGAMLMRREKC